MDSLYNCGKIQIRKSPIEGYGVFSTDFIKAGEFLEEVPFILFSHNTQLGQNLFDYLNNIGFGSEKEKYIDNLRLNLGFKDPSKYFFKWNVPNPLNGEIINWVVLPGGFGPYYNSSNTRNNASWLIKEKTFIFKADKDIQKDEEICTFFGYFLSETGQIFNCQDVLNLALDYNSNKIVKCYAARFGEINQFHASQTNPAYQRLGQLFGLCKDGLRISKLTGLSPNGQEQVAFDMFPDAPMNLIYQKLVEFKNNSLPFIKVTVEYETQDGNQTSETVVFKK